MEVSHPYFTSILKEPIALIFLKTFFLLKRLSSEMFFLLDWLTPITKKSERNQIADRFRSEGAGEAAKIMGKKEKDLQQIESEAYKTVQQIFGEADANASAIYAAAYNKSTEAVEFYGFLKTLETYKEVLSSDISLFITTDNPLFRLLKSLD